MIKNRLAAAALAASMVPGIALAQTDALAPTITGETGGFSLFSGDTLRQGDWSFGLYANNWDRLLDVGPSEISLDWTRVSASLGYGLTDRWEISVMVPYDDYNFDNNDFPFVDDPDASGMGRVRIGSKWTISGDRDSDHSFGLNAFVEAPTGDNDLPAGDETGFGVGLDWRANKWLFNLGYHDTGSDDLGEEVLAGAGYLGQVSDQFFWITELLAAVQTGNSDLKDAYDLTSGGRYWFGPDSDWAFNFGLRVDLNQLSDLSEHCPLGGLLGLTYRPRTHAAPPPPEPEPVAAPVPPPPPPPPAPEPVAPPPPPAPAPKPEIREECAFAAGSARLSNICKAKFDEVALQLKQDPSATAEIIGYSDNAGSEASNQSISEQRAKNVMDYLVSRHGIDPSRLTSRGVGSAEPVASNDSSEGRAMNRRVVIIVRGQ